MRTNTMTRVGLCPDSGHMIPATDEALDNEGFADVLCPSCLTVFHVEGRRHKHRHSGPCAHLGFVVLSIPAHQALHAG